MKKLLLLISCLVLGQSYAQKNLLQAGPMVGYCEMTEAMIWVQTTQAAKVKIAYFETGKPAPVYFSDEVLTEKTKGFTAHLVADKIKEGKNYTYSVYINNQKVVLNYPTVFQSKKLWMHRTDAPDFSVATGSCAYINEPEVDRPGKGYGSGYQIFEKISDKNPNIMLWLGDNVYFREADWDSKTGIYHRYTHSRSIKEMQPLLAKTQNYALWDDHDFGPNDADRGYYYKHETQKAFKDFWANKTYGENPNQNEGIYSTFYWGDAQFFMLDNRFFKSPNDRKTGERVLLGSPQIQWLIDNLVSSRASFKIICIGGQTLNSDAVFENYATYPEEKEFLLNEIKQNNIRGVLFLSGDRHFSELSKVERENTYPLYDWTVSPLTSGVASSYKNELNKNRVEGSMFAEQNFGMLYFSGDKENRQVKLVLYNNQGIELWSKTILKSELK